MLFGDCLRHQVMYHSSTLDNLDVKQIGKQVEGGAINMIKIFLGILLGIVLVTYHPQISSELKSLFVDSGIRDKLVNQLEGI